MFPTYYNEDLRRLKLQHPGIGMAREILDKDSKPGNKVTRK